MNKINSASSNNSGTSSETSETQSVEDNISGTTPATTALPNSRIPKSWKRMKDATVSDKDAEAKRPPWRSVSVSTLPKPDKNALLRAKLLDASRRLRAGKCTVALQTDMDPTKRMRDISFGIQTDLVLYREVGVLTDGSYTRRKEGSDELILTYAVSQMTDAVQVMDVATQTLLPKISGDDFMAAYQNASHTNLETSQLSQIEQKLLGQIKKIRESQLQREQTFEIAKVHCVDGVNSRNETSASDTDTDSSATVKDLGGVLETDDNTSTLNASSYSATLLKPTLASWHFEYDESSNPWTNTNKHFEPYILSARTPWRSFLPLPLSWSRICGPQPGIDWSIFMLAVDELVQESNRLLDLIEQLAVRQHEEQAALAQVVVPPYQPQKLIFPSEHWLPIIEQQEKQLSEMLADTKLTIGKEIGLGQHSEK